jgi:FMN-dependent dehydrogenase
VLPSPNFFLIGVTLRCYFRCRPWARVGDPGGRDHAANLVPDRAWAAPRRYHVPARRRHVLFSSGHLHHHQHSARRAVLAVQPLKGTVTFTIFNSPQTQSTLSYVTGSVSVKGMDEHHMRLRDCHNFHDFRRLARSRIPGPIFDYIDGAADDEVTYRRNTASFERCDLVPNVLRGVESVDMSVTVMGQRLAMPFYCSPTALQRLFHHQGERAVAAAAAKYGTMFGVSSLGTVSLEELRKEFDTPQVYQFYFHKDRGLNRAMMQRAKDAGINVLMLTVDSITGGNRERDLRTGFSIPFRLTVRGMLQFAIRPMWALNYVTHESFKLPQPSCHRSFQEICRRDRQHGDRAQRAGAVARRLQFEGPLSGPVPTEAGDVIPGRALARTRNRASAMLLCQEVKVQPM